MREPPAWCVLALSIVVSCALALGLPDCFLPHAGPAPGECALLLAGLAAASVHDVRTRMIPDSYALAMLAAHASLLAGGAFVGMGPAWVAPSLAGFAVLGVGSLAFALCFQRATGRSGMGGGDIKLLAAIGFVMGPVQGMAALACACAVFCAQVLAVGLVERVMGVSHAPSAGASGILAETHPFVPALAGGALLAVVAAPLWI